MLTLDNAERALKSVYLSAVTDLLNTKVNPLLTKIKQTNSDIWGKEIRKSIKLGLNGGVGAGDEDGNLPLAKSTKYIEFVSTLKNLYGQIEISDKAVAASQDGKSGFTDLLTTELEDLLTASKFNLGRMLYGDGTGRLCGVLSDSKQVDHTRNLMAGMCVDLITAANAVVRQERILSVDRDTNIPTLEIGPSLPASGALYVQGSKGKELTGLGAIFDAPTLYGITKTACPSIKPTVMTGFGSISDIEIQKVVDKLENTSNGTIDFLACSADVKYAYQNYLSQFRRNVDVVELAGGFKSISFNGIPLVYDRFVAPGTMYLLDTTAFKLHQLCDWRFLESENGRILRQVPGKAAYSATLVKYCDLICDRPSGQARITGITA